MSIRPDWAAIADSMPPELSDEEQQQLWLIECKKWLGSIADEFGGSYRIAESENFLILSDESDRYVDVFSSFLERTLKRILKTLNGIAADDGFGKHVAVIFKDSDEYYRYVSLFYPEEGEFGMSAGMYINEGYGHFIFPSQDITYAEPTAVHELTHACLSHLPIPLWLDEGLAVLMEDALAGNHLYLDQEIVSRHQAFWNLQTIQEFWSGDSFSRIDEGQELSYNLAHVLVRNLVQNFEVFAQFCNLANYSDAGEQAAQEVLGCSLAHLVGSFLGEGDFKPRDKVGFRKGLMDEH